MALSYVQIRSICVKFGDVETEVDLKEEITKKDVENGEKDENSKVNQEKPLVELKI